MLCVTQVRDTCHTLPSQVNEYYPIAIYRIEAQNVLIFEIHVIYFSFEIIIFNELCGTYI